MPKASRKGWTKERASYRILEYEDEFSVTYINGFKEIWKLPKMNFKLDEVKNRLQGPSERGERGLFGREFLKKYGKKVFSIRMP